MRRTGQYIGETAWNESASFGAASGGGVSVLYKRPSYQSGVAAHALGRSALASGLPGRGVPDVALNASIIGGVLVVITDPTSGQPVVYIVGGTSVSSPEFAAIVADGVQLAKHHLGFLNHGTLQNWEEWCLQ